MICAGGLIVIKFQYNIDLYKFYSENLRTALFSGFLTIGGFLMSLKTFIIVKLKEDLFDKPAYKKRHKENTLINAKKAGTLYEPLKQLSDYLILCVICSLVTAFLQFSIGFWEICYTAALCMSLALVSLTLVIDACWLMKKNLDQLFALLKDEE
jgi:hypothetical protein